ncbi:MAG: type II toxin-antitoxin system VapC family toxin [Leptolyngbya sp. DLM2.Bin15]|nr:MAG: type II toxin-antitoxin system VapC family toxin [Leptolyngbya sp. DLM2.Bin15]
MYLLDTNACIRLLNKSGNSHFVEKFLSYRPADYKLCSVVKHELYYGAYKSSRVNENLIKLERFFENFESLTLCDQSSAIAGDIRRQLERSGQTIGVYDMLIAAIALANNLIVITHNTREFSRVAQLQYEDWES